MNYISMTKAEVANGCGVRVALWLSGCEHCCKGCQNPEAWDYNLGEYFTEDDFNRLVSELSLPYYEGLTLTGGDPLSPKNVSDVELLLIKLKQLLPDKTIWCYTGYIFEEIKDLSIMKYIDVLIDGPYIDSQRDITLAFRGSTNQRVINVQQSLKENKTVTIQN